MAIPHHLRKIPVDFGPVRNRKTVKQFGRDHEIRCAPSENKQSDLGAVAFRR